MSTKNTKVSVTLSDGSTIETEVALGPGERVVTASAALSAVLGGRTIRPSYHDDKLQVKYVRGLGLQWVGEPGVVAKTLSGPEYLWKSLNNDKDSCWIIPGEPTQRGRWFDGGSKTYVDVRAMTDQHVDNALSWLALKATELKTEKKRRARAKETAERAELAKKQEAARIQRKREKAEARKKPETFTGADAILKAFTQGKRLTQEWAAKNRINGYYSFVAGKGLVYTNNDAKETKPIFAGDLLCIIQETWVEVK